MTKTDPIDAPQQQVVGAEIAVRDSSDVEALQELKRILVSGVSPDQVAPWEDPEDISRDIVMQLLSAKTDAELEMMGAAQGWRELEGVPVEINGFSWRPSRFEQGPGVFFVVRGVRLDTGEPVVLTTGSANVLAQLTNMAERGTLIGAVRKLVQAEKATQAGYHPLWLVTP